MAYGTSYHMLDIVSMAGTVNVRIVSLWRLIFHMSRVYCDSPLSLLWYIVNVAVGLELCTSNSSQNWENRGKAMIDSY